jgi:hypothetical protein
VLASHRCRNARRPHGLTDQRLEAMLTGEIRGQGIVVDDDDGGGEVTVVPGGLGGRANGKRQT